MAGSGGHAVVNTCLPREYCAKRQLQVDFTGAGIALPLDTNDAATDVKKD